MMVTISLEGPSWADGKTGFRPIRGGEGLYGGPLIARSGQVGVSGGHLSRCRIDGREQTGL